MLKIPLLSSFQFSQQKCCMTNTIETDYIIIGQGLCGTFLSYYLQKAGKNIIVIDEPNPYSSSKAASGAINPVTGRRIVRTWMIEEVMPFAVTIYQQLEKELNVSIIQQTNIIDFHPTTQMKFAFAERMQKESFLKIPDNIPLLQKYFNFYFGAGEINPSWLVDMQNLLSAWRKKLSDKNLLREEKFEIENLVVEKDAVTYKNIHAQKIFFCDGIEGTENPYFKLLPYSRNKGEVIIAKIPGLPRTNIFKQSFAIVPWKEDLFWVGSTYEWKFADANPTELFRKKVEEHLKQWLKIPFEIIDHFASIRPANMERRPFVGLHPVHSSIGLLNGMGTKGCTLGPYFAHQLAEHLINHTSINPLADVKRFTKILSR